MKAAEAAKNLSAIWGLVALVGGGIFFAYDWKRANDADMEKLEIEVAPAVKAIERSTKKVSRAVELLTEDRLQTQIAMEQKCEEPKNDMPRDYCEDVLRKKRLREAREKAQAEEMGGAG